MNLFNLSLRLQGYPLSQAEASLGAIHDIAETDYSKFISEQKTIILEHHFQQNNFYRDFCRNEKPTSWEAVPVLKKSDLQHPLQSRLSDGYTKNNCYVNKTSGSSGEPFIFAKDKLCHAMTWADVFNRYNWHGIDLNTSYQARFYGIPLDGFGYYRERFKDWLAKRHRFPIFDLSERNFENFFKTFQNKKFDHISGYTSALVLFAKFLKRKGVVLKTVCPTLRYCFVTSEMLFEDDKDFLEDWFGIPILNEYGASEFGLIAFETTERKLKINTETLFVEVLDEQNNVLPHGKPGKLVITSLYNKAHPMIRYEIGDVGVISKDSCGKTMFLEKLVGRQNENVLLPSGKVVPGLSFYYVTKTVIKDTGKVKEFVIHQQNTTDFEITYVAETDFNTTEIEAITNAVSKYLEDGLNMSFNKVQHINRTKAGKLKQFTRGF